MSFSRMLGWRVASAALAIAALGATGAHAAGLDGQSIGVNIHAVDVSSNVLDGPVTTVTAPDTATFDGGLLSATYTDHQIVVTDPTPSSGVFFLTATFPGNVPLSFNGLQFQTGPVITSVTFDPAETVTGALVSFTSEPSM